MKKENDLGKDSVGRLVLRLAIPTMIAQFVNILYSIIDRMYIGNIPKIGDLALAGVGICGPIVTLLSSFGTLVGLGGSLLMAMRQGGGTQAILSYNYGARQIQRVKRAEWHILKLGILFTTGMFLFTQLAAPYFVRIFTAQTDLLTLAVWGIKVYALGVIPLSFQYVLVDGLTALGRTKTALFLSLFRKGGYVFFTLLFPAILTAKVVFYAEPVMDVLSSLLSTIVYLCVIGGHLRKREQTLPGV